MIFNLYELYILLNGIIYIGIKEVYKAYLAKKLDFFSM